MNLQKYVPKHVRDRSLRAAVAALNAAAHAAGVLQGGSALTVTIHADGTRRFNLAIEVPPQIEQAKTV